MHSNLASFSEALRRFIRECQSVNADLTAGDTNSAFGKLALSLYRLQFHFNEPYRRLCQTQGYDATGVTDWRDIPTVSTAAFKAVAFSSLPASERTRLFESSGTTQESRSRHVHSLASLKIYEASLLPWFRRHMLGSVAGCEHQTQFTDTQDACPARSESLVLVSLTPSTEQAPTSSLVHMLAVAGAQDWFDAARFFGNVERAEGWTLDCAAVWSWLQRVSDENVRVLVAGTAFNFVHLLQYLEQHGLKLRLPAGSRIMETGGYKGRSRSLTKAELHSWISDTLQVPPVYTVTEYGMTELGSQAYDRIAGCDAEAGPLRFPPWARAQVVSPESGQEVEVGEVGLLRVFDLANVYSVMAVETEDLAIRGSDGPILVGRRALAEPRGCSLMAV